MGYTATQRMGAGSATVAAGPTRAIPGYEYGPEEDEYTEDGGGRKRRTWMLWAAGVLLVLAVLGGVAYAFFGGNGGVAVPQVSGLPVGEATSQVHAAGLVPKVVREPSATVHEGIVISTNPANGNLVARGTTVTLNVSNGPPKVAVPNVLHQSAADARNVLISKGFHVNEVTDQASTAKPNTVVQQNPAPNTMVIKGSTVTISVSPGGSQIPNVVNQQLAIAEGNLANAGFTNVRTQNVTDPGLANGIVTQQSPPAGGNFPTSTLITLTVVNNPPPPTPTPTPTTPTPTTPTPTPTPTSS
jgi:serine/threonine-protein kinase